MQRWSEEEVTNNSKVLNLTNIGGTANIFVLLATTSKNFRENGVPKADIESMIKEVGKSGNYHKALSIIVGYADKYGIEIE
jgi:hypothetical protein